MSVATLPLPLLTAILLDGILHCVPPYLHYRGRFSRDLPPNR